MARDETLIEMKSATESQIEGKVGEVQAKLLCLCVLELEACGRNVVTMCSKRSDLNSTGIQTDNPLVL